MGMDLYIYRARTKAAFDAKGWYNDKEIIEVWYARRFWGILNAIPSVQKEGYGEVLRLTRNDLEEMIEYATHNRDYWNTFNSVPGLCEILDTFDTWEEKGWHFYLYVSE